MPRTTEVGTVTWNLAERPGSPVPGEPHGFQKPREGIWRLELTASLPRGTPPWRLISPETARHIESGCDPATLRKSPSLPARVSCLRERPRRYLTGKGTGLFSNKRSDGRALSSLERTSRREEPERETPWKRRPGQSRCASGSPAFNVPNPTGTGPAVCSPLCVRGLSDTKCEPSLLAPKQEILLSSRGQSLTYRRQTASLPLRSAGQTGERGAACREA